MEIDNMEDNNVFSCDLFHKQKNITLGIAGKKEIFYRNTPQLR